MSSQKVWKSKKNKGTKRKQWIADRKAGIPPRKEGDGTSPTLSAPWWQTEAIDLTEPKDKDKEEDEEEPELPDAEHEPLGKKLKNYDDQDKDDSGFGMFSCKAPTIFGP